jgi:single-strand DNA-binding protein
MLNRVVIVGRLTKDPELRYTSSGVAIATFTLAVNRPFKNQNGEQEADFINCVVWRKPAENVANYLKKGSLAGVDGRLQTRSYEGQNGRVFVTEVIADSVSFLDSKGKSSPNENKANTGQNLKPENTFNPYATDNDFDPLANVGTVVINDDDLPF